MSDTQKQAIGERLAQERARLGWSQTEAARLAGVGFSTYGAYEQGRSTPNAECLQLLAQHGVDVLFVVTGEATSSVLTPDEAAVLHHLRSCHPALQCGFIGFFNAYIGALSKSCNDH